MIKLIRLIFFSILCISVTQPIFADGEGYEWFKGYRRLETEHFEIIFEPQDIEAAREIYTFCEEVYDEVTGLLDSYPKRIRVLLHGRIDMANGSYYPVPEHLNLYITSPIDYFNGARTESWLRSLLVHELTHYVHISYEKGWLYGLSKVFGAPIKAVPGGFMPGWMLEGFTTNAETMFSGGGRGRNPLFEMIYKSHILEGNLFSLKQAAYGSSLPPYNRIYVSGYIFMDYLIRQYGRDVLKQIHGEMVRNPFVPDQAVERVTGKTTRQLWDEMRLELMKKYRPFEDVEEGTLISPYADGSWSLPRETDRGLLLYRQDQIHPPGLIFYDPVSGESRQIVKTHLTDRWSFTADKSGKRVVYAAFDADAGRAGSTAWNADLFELREGRRRAKRITRKGHLWHPSLSADGNRLVAVQKRGSYSRLVEVNMEDGEIKALFSLPQSTVFNPTLSPDGSKILFILNIRGKQDLWILDNEGARPLTGFNNGAEYYPVFLNDNEVLFSGDESGTMQLYRMNLQTGEMDLQLRDPVGVLSASTWKGDLVYSSYRSRGYSLFLASERQLQDIETMQINETVVNEQQKETPLPPRFSLNDYPAPLRLEEAIDRFYPDTPKFLGWAPLPFYYTEIASAESAAGIGAAFFSQSVDKDTYLQALVSFPFTVFQPAIFFDASFPVGLLNVSYRLNQQYGSYGKAVNGDVEKVFYQYSYQNLRIRLPLYYHQVSGKTYAFRADAGLVHRYTMEGSEPFHLFDAPDNNLDQFEVNHTLDQYSGLSFHFGRSRARESIYPELQASASIGVLTGLPLLSRDEAKILGSMDLALSVPLVPRHNLFTEFNIGYADHQSPSFSFAPRGFSSPSISLQGKAIATLGYNYNFKAMDLPLFAGFSFQGLAAAFFLQTQFWYDFTGSPLKPDTYLYAGVELMPILGFSEGKFPITIGVNFRFDLSLENSFNSETDIAPYFSINMDFISSYKNRRPSWQPKNSRAKWKNE